MQPDTEHVAQGLKIVAALKVATGKEIILSISGRLRAAGNKVLSAFEEPRCVGPANPFLSGIVLSAQRSETTAPITVEFFAPLSQAAVAHIEEERRRVDPNDAIFKIEVWGQSVLPSNMPLFTDSFSTVVNGQNVQLIKINSTQKEGDWAVVQDHPATGFVRSATFSFGQEERVHASNWLTHFAPRLGLGTFVLVELPQPTAPNGTPLDEPLTAALRDLGRARAELLTGEDDEAIKALRRPAEIIRARLPQVESLLIVDGYPQDAAGSYGRMIREQFDFCSKFLHTVDKDGKTLRPDVHAKREDVLFVFSATVNALNVLVSKGRRHAPPR